MPRHKKGFTKYRPELFVNKTFLNYICVEHLRTHYKVKLECTECGRSRILPITMLFFGRYGKCIHQDKKWGKVEGIPILDESADDIINSVFHFDNRNIYLNSLQCSVLMDEWERLEHFYKFPDEDDPAIFRKMQAVVLQLTEGILIPHRCCEELLKKKKTIFAIGDALKKLDNSYLDAFHKKLDGHKYREMSNRTEESKQLYKIKNKLHHLKTHSQFQVHTNDNNKLLRNNN